MTALDIYGARHDDEADAGGGAFIFMLRARLRRAYQAWRCRRRGCVFYRRRWLRRQVIADARRTAVPPSFAMISPPQALICRDELRAPIFEVAKRAAG